MSNQQLSALPLEEIPFIDTEVVVPVNLSAEDKSKWNRLVNKFFHGKELIPLDEKVSQDNKDASWHVSAGKRVTIPVRLYADGSMAVLENSMTSRSHKLSR